MESLASHTTLRLGGPATLSIVDSDEQLLEAARAGHRLLAGGSNVVIGDEGLNETVALVRTRGVTIQSASAGAVQLRVAAGEPFDELIEYALAEGLSGLEALSGIPGSAGATPIQNVGAYGAEVSQWLSAVQVYDRARDRVRLIPADSCAFSYRHSLFKADSQRYVVLAVVFELPRSVESQPVRYAELAQALGVDVGQSAPAALVREAVLTLRRGKGMVLDSNDYDTWSAGSFFTNPVLEPDAVNALRQVTAPLYRHGEGFKTSAAWLIEQAGFPKGYSLTPHASVSLSTKHTLALTNRGSATTAELLHLARAIRDGVADRFGVTLVNEPVLWGCQL